MGSTHAAGFAEMVVEGAIAMRTAVANHLRTNHVPPVHFDFVKPAMAAIMAGAQEEWDEQIELPNGIVMSASEVVDGLNLIPFVEAQAIILADEDDDPFNDEITEFDETFGL